MQHNLYTQRPLALHQPAMKVQDYSPPTDPTLDQQRDALQKGLGRAS